MGASDNFKAIGNLNELLAETINARLRFRTVAKMVQNDKLKLICEKIALQRASYIGEIEAAIRELGGEPDERGTALGKAHLSWISIRSKLSGGAPTGILAECIRGEQFVIDQHKGMLRHRELPQYVRNTLKRHLEQVETDVHRLNRIYDYFQRQESK